MVRLKYAVNLRINRELA